MTREQRIAIVVPVIFLVPAIAISLPYGFFTLLRLIVCASSVYLAWTIRDGGKYWVAAVFLVIAILFNPIFPIYLNRETWVVIDIAVTVFFIASFIFLKTNKTENEDYTL